MAPELSVVVPTYNRLEMLALVVPTLLEQDLPLEDYEVLICDSNSNDGTAEYLRGVTAAHSNVRQLPGSYSGRAAARNAGITAARGGIVLFNDADILASSSLLSAHLQRHRERRHVAVVGLEVQVKNLHEYRCKRDRAHERGHLHPPSRKRLSWLYFLTGNASVARDDLLRAGCFDETFTGYGHEDLELGYRLHRIGVEILYEPSAVNYHCQEVGYEDQKMKMRLAGQSASRFYRKHRDLEVLLKLGMTPVSRGAHSVLSRLPWVLGYLDRRAATSRLAREAVLQYFYVSGIKDAG
ncbi:MAG: glycosyltransferase [Candidatus Eremiobacteraeota bacterium]|nr:glycosyltransferase [Candidatus Eremiobacteraeota bacterium]